MSIPVSQLTIEQAHKQFTSLVDKTAAKYEHLDSGEFGAVGNPSLMQNLLNWHVLLLI